MAKLRLIVEVEADESMIPQIPSIMQDALSYMEDGDIYSVDVIENEDD